MRQDVPVTLGQVLLGLGLCLALIALILLNADTIDGVPPRSAAQGQQ